jgi:hypothetical protein
MCCRQNWARKDEQLDLHCIANIGRAAGEKAGGALGTGNGRRWRARSVVVLLMIGNIDDVNDRTLYDRSSRNMQKERKEGKEKFAIKELLGGKTSLSR